MRIMAASACKPDASKTLLIQQRIPEKPRAGGDSIWAIAPANCMQFRR
jgi:hypothetical protein